VILIVTKRWQRALIKELEAVSENTSDRHIKSVFFGGGTPSLMPPLIVESLMKRLYDLWPTVPSLEVTLEANPNDINKLKDLRSVGINRLSLGIQSLNDYVLRFLGRLHDRTEAIKALNLVPKLFDRYSFDLIYARPDHTVGNWKIELNEALSYIGDHFSLYQLTVEPGTLFYKAYQRGDWKLPSEGICADLYDVTGESLSRRGLINYEISNYAIPGFECSHNQIYWRYEDYIGIGPGAHSRLTIDHKKLAIHQHKSPEVWLQKVESQKDASHETITLSQKDRLKELLLMGLRLKEGVSRKKFIAEVGVDVEDCLDRTQLKTLICDDLIILDEIHFAATDQGRKKLDGILRWLDLD
jgi:putative oxygen-independent coproporphyrinogen III oxidase